MNKKELTDEITKKMMDFLSMILEKGYKNAAKTRTKKLPDVLPSLQKTRRLEKILKDYLGLWDLYTTVIQMKKMKKAKPSKGISCAPPSKAKHKKMYRTNADTISLNAEEFGPHWR